ncbi:MAG: acetylxylan esterase [Bacteroidota bacterium]
MNTKYIVLLLFLFLIAFASAQTSLQLKTNHTNARYTINESIQIEVAGDDGIASYKIWQDQYTPIIEEGEIEIQNGRATIEFQHPKAAVLTCKVTQNGEKESIGIAINPFEVNALKEEPEDFDAFWDEAKTELQNVPLNPQLTFRSEDNHSRTYRINLGNIDDRRVYGYISIPKGSGTFPAMLILPPYGFTPNLVSPKQNICRDIGMIALSLSIHNVEPDTRDPDAYKPNDISNPYGNYYRQAVTGALQAINYLFTRDDFSGDLIVSGVSQGAGLAIMTAGLDERVKLLNFSGVTHAQHQGRTYGEASGFPYYLHQVRNSPQAEREAAQSAAQYYESIYFARRYQGKALMAIGYLDDVTHPSTQLAVFNALSGEKVLIHSQPTAHMHPSEFWQLRYAMGLQNFPYARAFAWQFATTNTGYQVEAGRDTTVRKGETLKLNAKAIFNKKNLENSEVEWQLVKGIGAVEWEDRNSLQPKVKFNELGTYVLKLRVHDYQDLDEKATYYTLENEMRIEVEEQNNESALSLTCAENLEVNLPIGAEKGIVEWQPPTVSSICVLGEANLEQISGVRSGEALEAGTYTIEYVATNPCGDRETCQLIVNVLYTAPESGYCQNQGEQPWQEWIQEVQLNDLRLFSQKEGYGDFLAYSTALETATTYEMSVQIGYSYLDTTEHLAVYIDFNQDSIFQEEERILEAVFTSASTRPGAQTFESTIIIPENAALGETRMRVLLNRAQTSEPCSIITYGEVEDYTIFFTQAEAPLEDTTLLISHQSLENQDIECFPNPVKDQLNFSFDKLIEKELLIRIFDSWGRVVKEQVIVNINDKQMQSMEMVDVVDGIYFVQVLKENTIIVSKRIVKLKDQS